MSVLLSASHATPSVSLQSPRNQSLCRMINRPNSVTSQHRPSPPPAARSPAPAPTSGGQEMAGAAKSGAAQTTPQQPPTPTSAPPSATKTQLAAFHPSRLQSIPAFRPKAQAHRAAPASVAGPSSPSKSIASPAAVPARLLRPGQGDRSVERRTSTGDFPSVLAPATPTAVEQLGGHGLGIVGVDVTHTAPPSLKKRRSSAMDHVKAAREAAST